MANGKPNTNDKPIMTVETTKKFELNGISFREMVEDWFKKNHPNEIEGMRFNGVKVYTNDFANPELVSIMYAKYEGATNVD